MSQLTDCAHIGARKVLIERGATVKLKVLGAGIVASLVLSACGSSTSSSLNSLVASLGSSQNLQVTLTVDATGAAPSKVAAVLKEFSIGMNFSNPGGGALSDSSGKDNTEITAAYKGTTVLDIRAVGPNLYFKADISALAGVPGFKLPSAQVAAMQLIFGARWFELPATIISSLVPTTHASAANTAKDRATITKAMDAITKIIDNAKVNDLGHGKFSESGTILSIAKALSSSVKAMGSLGTPTASNAKGTYLLTISTSGSTATGASIKITTPKDTGGNASVSLSASFAHDNGVVSKPNSPVVLTASMLASLFSKGLK